MKTPQGQYLVFTGLDGATLNSSQESLQEILPALELLRSRNIPLIAASMQAAQEVLPLIRALDLTDPFIVENGGAIYVPNDSLAVDFKYQRKVENYRLIELGGSRRELMRKLAKIRQHGRFDLQGLSELEPAQIAEWEDLDSDQVRAAQALEYSELIRIKGENGELQRFQAEIEQQQMRLLRYGEYHLLSGDHDEGSAVRILLQLYRESNPDKLVISVGLSDNYLDSSMLHAVDIPILVRQPDGRFDEQVGRFGMKFTRNPGPVGWSQAVIAIITEDAEA
jgi:mannosyl-3-phosphoglycerate phosphatase family protein